MSEDEFKGLRDNELMTRKAALERAAKDLKGAQAKAKRDEAARISTELNRRNQARKNR